MVIVDIKETKYYTSMNDFFTSLEKEKALTFLKKYCKDNQLLKDNELLDNTVNLNDVGKIVCFLIDCGHCDEDVIYIYLDLLDERFILNYGYDKFEVIEV